MTAPETCARCGHDSQFHTPVEDYLPDPPNPNTCSACYQFGPGWCPAFVPRPSEASK